MKVYLFLITFVIFVTSAPVDETSPKDAQSAFGPAFDEIVVESSLTVRRKNDATRQGRNKSAPIATASSNKREKRQFSGFSGFNNPQKQAQFGGPYFSGSVADAQAQSNSVKGPLGTFGSSASNAQNQAFNVGPNGLTASVGLAGTQQYRLPNGQIINLSYGNSGSSSNANAAKTASSVVTITNPDGSKINYR